MASKQLTYFLIDISPSMGRVCLPRDETDVGYAISYVKDHCSQIVVKNRKLDRIGFVIFNALARPLERVTILFQDSLLTCDQLKHAISQMCPSAESDHLSENQSDPSPDFYTAALKAMECFNAKRKLQFDRNLVIVSNLETETPSIHHTDHRNDDFCRLAHELKVKVVLSIVDLIDKPQTPIKESNIQSWKHVLDDCTDGEIYDVLEMNRAMVFSPCLKKIASHPIFSGQLRFGNSFDKPTSLLDSDPDSLSRPELWLSTTVQTFPACRQLNSHLTHGYFVSADADSLVRAHRKTTHYTKSYHADEISNESDFRKDWLEDGAEKSSSGFDKVPVEKSECVPGFRYSHEDIIALTLDLAQTARLKTAPGIDIMGLLERDKIPYAMCVQDSQYVVPIANALAGDKLSFNLLAYTMLNLKSVAIVRFVPFENADIQVAVLIPMELAINNDNKALGFTLTELAYKEDESLGSFVNLTKLETGQAESGVSIPNASDSREQSPRELEDDTQIPLPQKTRSRILPTKETEDLMDSFVLSKSLDTENESIRPTTILSNQKLAILRNQYLRLPSKAPFDPDTNLLPSCPSTSKFNNNLTKIVSYSLTQDSLVSVLEDPALVEKVLVDEKSSNLYNLANVLVYNTNPETDLWLPSINHKSLGTAKRLARGLDCQYHTTSTGPKKLKIDLLNAGTGEPGPAPFDSYFDVNLII